MTKDKRIMADASAYCQEKALRWTAPREMVLEIFSAADKPMGAYDVIDAMAAFRERPKPPTVYRAIDFWCDHGFLHKIDSLNAYILCHAQHRHQGSQFMICQTCGQVTEAHLCALPSKIQEKADEAIFSVASWTLEIHGQCSDCSANM